MLPLWSQSPFALYRVFLSLIIKLIGILNVRKEYLLEVKGIDSKNKNAIWFSFPTYVLTIVVTYTTSLVNKCALRYFLGKHYWNTHTHNIFRSLFP